MNTEQERAEFEAWAQNSFDLHRHSAGEYSSNLTQTAWAAWQAGRAALQSQEYTSAIGKAGQAYMDSFKYAHPLPVQFRWSELWEVMYAAANEGFPQSQDREDAERIDFIEANPGWLRVSRLGHRTKQMWACVSPFTSYECDLFKTAREAIDHARRIEGEVSDSE